MNPLPPLRRLRRGAAFSVLLATTALGAGPGPAHAAARVVIGAGGRWVELIPHPEQWEFVRANADGFYVNFIGMDHATQVQCNALAKVMTHKFAYLESDMQSATAAADDRSLLMLQIAGFTVPYTSLNYGWSRGRADNLKTFALPAGQAPRLCLVQEGPWTLGGDLNRDFGGNAQRRSYIDQADGDSTDGVMGFWQADTKGMRTGSFSMVKYAHAQGKQALVMVTPYAAKIPTYDPARDFLATAQQCVRQHEDAGAAPDDWSVFEYATNFPLLPETGADGRPANTLAGMAFWLIHHLRDPDHAARLEFVPAAGEPLPASTTPDGSFNLPAAPLSARGAPPAARTLTFALRNDSPWLDLCPVIRARVSAAAAAATRCTLDGHDVTAAILREGGVVCVGELRLWPQSTRELQITLPAQSAPADVHLELLPHPSAAPAEARQRLDVHVSPDAAAILL
jgi:hypothetical protein